MYLASFISRGQSKILPGLAIKKQSLNQNVYHCICELSVNIGSTSEASDMEYTTQVIVTFLRHMTQLRFQSPDYMTSDDQMDSCYWEPLLIGS